MKALALILAATTAQAEASLTADAFEAHVAGRTLSYGANGDVYGHERYHAGRYVTWQFVDDACSEGRWYPDDAVAPNAICFVYDDDPTPKCWQFYDTGGRLRAQFLNDPGTGPLYELDLAAVPLTCPGPDAGV